MNRKAYVIGNSNYLPDKNKLNNPINDANAITEILEYKGFQVTKHLDDDNNNMKKNFEVFLKQVEDNDLIIFYFAGHGVEYRDSNYLLPTNFSFPVEKTSLSIDEIQNKLHDKNPHGIKLIITDACRNTPDMFETTGFSKVQSIHNTLIAFSTAPGSTAKDGTGDFGTYTKYLIENIKKYNQPIHNIFSNTRELVIKETNFKQIPWEHSSLVENVSFDNIQVPKKLFSLVKSQRDICYTVKYFNEMYCFGFNAQYLQTCTKNLENLQSIETNLEEINEIDVNKNSLVFVSNNKVLYCNSESKSVKIIYEHDDIYLHTVSINENNMILAAGESSLMKLINANTKEIIDIDLKEEVIKIIYTRPDQINYISNNLAIYSSNFNKDILAFGGSNHIFCIKNIINNQYLYINKTDKFLFTYSIAFSLDGLYIATSHEKGKTILWDSKNFDILYIFQINEFCEKNEFFEFKESKVSNDIHHVEFTPDSKALAIGTSESKILFFDLKYRTLIDAIDLNIEPLSIYGFTFDREGNHLITSINQRIYFFTK